MLLLASVVRSIVDSVHDSPGLTSTSAFCLYMESVPMSKKSASKVYCDHCLRIIATGHSFIINEKSNGRVARNRSPKVQVQRARDIYVSRL